MISFRKELAREYEQIKDNLQLNQEKLSDVKHQYKMLQNDKKIFYINYIEKKVASHIWIV